MSSKAAVPFSRDALEQVLKRRVSGLYDYGPPGCGFQANIVDTWRKHFILEEDMLEVDTTMLTPYEVLKTSGHVDKFTDWMCKDLKTGEIFRADHLVEEVLEARLKGDKAARGQQVEEKDDKKRKKKVKEIKNVKLEDAVVAEYESHDITNPATGGKLEPPVEFNLMFDTAIGPSGQLKGYLRPETAQGQFLNFAKLLEFNNEKMPFASAAIGKSFRNEISLFLMAEIEHFVDPEDKSHPRFAEVKDLKLKFLPKDVQEAGSNTLVEKTIGEAVSTGMVDNETLGYFIARIYQFLIKIGVDSNRCRFRQHLSNEMAHYASDCWDAELETSYGWVECVGCADRSAYDLSVHSARTNEKLVVRKPLDQPRTVNNFEVDIDKKKFGPKFRKDAGAVTKFLTDRTQCELEDLAKELADTGKISADVPNVGQVEVPAELVKIERVERTEHVREFTPNVIEPSFGLGRIIYSIFEHSFWARPEDKDRSVLSLPPLVAPTKVLVVPLSSHADLTPLVGKITSALRKAQVPFKVDDSSASIGKRYARNDELGTPFGITIDFDTVKDGSVTLRERDSTKQVRGSLDDIVKAVKAITYDGVSWTEGTSSLTPFETVTEEK
ncbi:glycine-tRNA ligase [Candidozyma duobushaemuli]|uniref:Glycine-tRNA ligase n=1 Tax=Candidozyma duobushaemuli TaxID=1231522 RepID=A0A2V1A857_9ASCO|nr:glycine-tRNA ligase [[Candida] duobushaemulonis]PVH13845.1 glycine-tRNA ligase [[Candida] duobushaemulonis]